MKLRRPVTIIAATAATVLTLTAAGCGNNFRDVENVPSEDADSYTIYNNVDKHPNLVRVCADGVAFLTTTRDYTAVQRVPEWDDECAAAAR